MTCKAISPPSRPALLSISRYLLLVLTLFCCCSGVSQGVLGTSRLIGGAIATAVYTAIQTNRYTDLLAPNVAAAAEAHGFNGSMASLVAATANGTAAAYEAAGATVPVMTEVIAAVKESYAESFQLVYKVAVAFGGLAVLVATTCKNIDVEKKSNERAVRLENEHLETMGEKVSAV